MAKVDGFRMVIFCMLVMEYVFDLRLSFDL